MSTSVVIKDRRNGFKSITEPKVLNSFDWTIFGTSLWQGLLQSWCWSRTLLCLDKVCTKENPFNFKWYQRFIQPSSHFPAPWAVGIEGHVAPAGGHCLGSILTYLSICLFTHSQEKFTFLCNRSLNSGSRNWWLLGLQSTCYVNWWLKMYATSWWFYSWYMGFFFFFILFSSLSNHTLNMFT